MPSKRHEPSVEELRSRWRDHIEWIGEEANFMTGHQTRYRLIQTWLFSYSSRTWFNRHFQALGWISGLWLTTGLMSVRRQLDGQHGSISLLTLLREIERRPDVVNANTADVVSDRKTLERDCAGALQFAQRQLAHRVPSDELMTSFTQLDAALDAIAAVTKNYYRLIFGQDMDTADADFEPDPDWLKSFDVAWRRPRAHRRLNRRRGHAKDQET